VVRRIAAESFHFQQFPSLSLKDLLRLIPLKRAATMPIASMMKIVGRRRMPHWASQRSFPLSRQTILVGPKRFHLTHGRNVRFEPAGSVQPAGIAAAIGVWA